MPCSIKTYFNDYFASPAFQQADEEAKCTIALFQIQLLDLQNCDHFLLGSKKLQQAQNYLGTILPYGVNKKLFPGIMFLITGKKTMNENKNLLPTLIGSLPSLA
ncbi:hypothetical protein [Neochlamydia sp. AcF95]|uniref:hypothetical protein n=1 Tax=Neochlamydia sp. AcF95 TaxID=2795734 RepID=UPI001BC9A193|nr:hypothetical protein [Neochlamydia sp. AcF95]NGY95966.1 hypothetical protein [Neochlamydia sp. AcF84]